MKDEDLSRDELLAELAALRLRVTDLEIEGGRTARWLELVQGVNVLKEKLLAQGSLELKLKRITDGLVEIFGTDFARIWIARPGDRCDSGCVHAKVSEGPHVCLQRNRCLHLMASSDRYTHIDGQLHRRVPFDCYKIGRIASGAEPKFLTNDVSNDSRIHGQDWARELGLVAIVGYPLLSKDSSPIGVMALFAKHLISQEEEAMLEGLANTTSQVIQAAAAEEARRESENRYRSLVETSPDPIITYDLEGNLITVNQQTAIAYGVDSPEQFLQEVKNVSDILDEKSREMAADNLKQTLETGSSRKTEYTVMRQDGSTILVEINSSMVRKADETPLGFISVVRDITDRKRAEEQLKKSRGIFSSILNSVPQSIFWKDTNSVYLGCNEVFARAVGLESPDQIVGKTDYDLPWPRKEADAYRSDDQDVMISNRPKRHIIEPLQQADGNRLWIDTTKAPLLDQNNNVYGVLGVYDDITERKMAEETLREREQQYRNIFESVSDGLLIFDLDGRVVEANPAACSMHGYSREEMIGMTGPEFVHPDFHERFAKFCETAPGEIFNEEPLDIRKDGTLLPLQVRGATFTFRSKNHILAVITDITKRKLAEAALRESEDRFRIAFQTSPDAVNINRLSDGLYVDVNEGFSEITGFTRDEVIGKSSLEINIWHDPEDRKRLVAGLKERGYVRNLEAQFRYKDGRIRHGLMSARLIILRGEPHILSVTRDVDDWKRAEEAIRSIVRGVSAEIGDRFFDSSVAQFARILNADFTLIGEIFDQDREAVVKTVAFCAGGQLQKNIVYDLKGAPCEEVTKKGICSYPRGVAQLFPRDMGLQRRKIEAYVGVCLYDSRSRPIGIMAAMYLKPLENVEFAESVLQIFASRAAAEIDRKNSEKNLKRLFTAVEQAGESILITDPMGGILYANPAFAATSGYSLDEIIGETSAILKSGKHDHAFYEDMWSTIKRGQVWRGRFTNKKKDGSLYDETSTISPIKDEAGNILNFVMVGRDVTSEVLLQKQLFHAQKMEAIGTLAGGIAHDVNNLLQAVLGYADLLLMKKSPRDPDCKKLKIIQEAARDGADLVSRILTFSRKGESKPRPVDLNEEIRKAEKLLRRTLPRMIEIELMLAEDIGIIDADPTQLEQVIINLGVNAQHAMPNGGRLLLETSNVSLSDEYLRAHLGAKKGKYVLLTVSDTGVGMEPAVVERIFEPFFTTKPNGLGTGLGLSMVHGIVTQHGGYIRCYSEPGRGTSFKIYLPVSDRELAFDPTLTREMPAFGTETILLVDDDDRIREMGMQMIEVGGYKVLVAKSGEEALEIYSSHKEEIALIILDLIMPGMGGSRCLRELVRIDPDVRVLVASGYSSDGLAQGQESIGARGFVSKPYDAKDILTAIRRVMDKGTL